MKIDHNLDVCFRREDKFFSEVKTRHKLFLAYIRLFLVWLLITPWSSALNFSSREFLSLPLHWISAGFWYQLSLTTRNLTGSLVYYKLHIVSILSVYRPGPWIPATLFILMLLEAKASKIALRKEKKRFKDIRKNKNHLVKHSGKINIQVILGMCQFICCSDPFLLLVNSECPYLLYLISKRR